MEIIDFTNDIVFNTVFTMYTYMSAMLVPMFALLALLRN